MLASPANVYLNTLVASAQVDNRLTEDATSGYIGINGIVSSYITFERYLSPKTQLLQGGTWGDEMATTRLNLVTEGNQETIYVEPCKVLILY